MTQDQPHTAASLADDLRSLGLAAGDTVLVHTSVRAIGFVAGGVQAVVQALLDVLGRKGTLVVPTHTPSNTDPVDWSKPPVPADWWPIIRAQSPGFDPLRTPSQWVGILPETVRCWPGARRSEHPQVSFAALGARATAMTDDHPLDEPFGERSPVGAVYRSYGKVLLLGCGHHRNSSLHLAESRQELAPMADYGSSVRGRDGTAYWATWVAADQDVSDFDEIGAAFEATGAVTVGTVGEAEARLMPQRELVDFATGWMGSRPGKTL
ncbi:aminoglycoside N(3)-acetyltransferase [Actinoplanes awajinensis]|uniref:Aminoglycoside N(3)-acetyltransferase n=1 Tax=Actinoplanes awajinensis subsp. mycoplanecinus TaxID=135947 RepID=A0A101JKJ9_9ACTN|nr:AAC(3) family N-acetyltransferase [Actinoplanes awajinensis]KUL28543.1 aminoglycoside phosphotransferase [Actinoplanes awajinensis subsp. mycoplanecinus]